MYNNNRTLCLSLMECIAINVNHSRQVHPVPTGSWHATGSLLGVYTDTNFSANLAIYLIHPMFPIALTARAFGGSGSAPHGGVMKPKLD
jgi:hypothetical protein